MAHPVYYEWKYKADIELVRRTAFKWTLVRPGGLIEEPGAGTAAIGRTHLTSRISVSSGVTSNGGIIDKAFRETMSLKSYSIY